MRRWHGNNTCMVRSGEKKARTTQGWPPQLSTRVGILKKLYRSAFPKNLKILTNGLFYSKLSYCLPLFTNTWGLDRYKDGGTRFSCYTKEDKRKLQVLQNQVTRLFIRGSGFDREKRNYLEISQYTSLEHSTPSVWLRKFWLPRNQNILLRSLEQHKVIEQDLEHHCILRKVLSACSRKLF